MRFRGIVIDLSLTDGCPFTWCKGSKFHNYNNNYDFSDLARSVVMIALFGDVDSL
jgi:hypothetical protein